MWKGVHIFFVLIVQTKVVESEKLFFNSTNSKFSDSDCTRSNSPTSAHVKKKSNSILKYAAMATPIQQYCYKQDCGVGVPGVACFKSDSKYYL